MGPAGTNFSWDSCTPTPSAVQVKSSQRVRFKNCSFTRLGSSGLSFSGGSQSNSIEASYFEDISGTAITIGGVNTSTEKDQDRHDVDNSVEDCIITNVGREWLGTCGITAFFSRGTLISHNRVSHVPYTGISIGWGWGSAQDDLWPQMPWDSNNTVSHNEVREAVGIMGDGGSIYTLGPQGNRPDNQTLPLPPLKLLPPSRIFANYLHDNGWPTRPRNSVPGDGTHGPGGLYTDNGSTNWNVTSNVFVNTTVWAIACYTDGIEGNNYTKNEQNAKHRRTNSLLRE